MKVAAQSIRESCESCLVVTDCDEGFVEGALAVVLPLPCKASLKTEVLLARRAIVNAYLEEDEALPVQVYVPDFAPSNRVPLADSSTNGAFSLRRRYLKRAFANKFHAAS